MMIWPEAPSHYRRGRTGMTDHARAIFARHPVLAEAFTKVLCRRTNVESIEKLWRRATQGLWHDTALLDDPLERADIVRGCKQASVGMMGFMNEALVLAKVPPPLPARVADSVGWTLFFGAGYKSYDLDDARAFWKDALPDATVELIDNAAHFMHVTHVGHVIAALDRASGRVAVPRQMVSA
jgi:hypothetical protein